MSSNWYYAAENRQMGPIPEAELDSLVATDVVAPQTLVWREGMDTWRAYSSARASEISGPVSPCGECQRPELQVEMVRFGPNWICAACKDLYVQRLREGTLKRGMTYATFWRRVGAYLIDGSFLFLIQVGLQLLYTRQSSINSNDIFVVAPKLILLQVINFTVQMGYYSLTIYWLGGTPGKLLLGCRVVMSNGEPLGLGRCFARYFASLLSFFALGIGYLMAAFDEETRTMHDRICDTRVILKSGPSA